MRFQETILTPELATQLLQGNTGNRKLDISKVNQWTAEIKSGRWRATHEPIAIAKDGRVVDGQHRLHAVIKAQSTIPVVICWDADPDTFGIINVGKIRTGSDIWSIAGFPSSNCAAIAKLVFLYEHDRLIHDWHNRGRIAADLILRWCQQSGYMDIIRRAALREKDFRKHIKGVGASLGASLVLSEIHGGDDRHVDEIYGVVFNPVVTCIGLQEGTPAYALNRIFNGRDSRAGKEGGNPFRSNFTGLNAQRARLSILLRVIADTLRGKSRQFYQFDTNAMPDLASLLNVENCNAKAS